MVYGGRMCDRNGDDTTLRQEATGFCGAVKFSDESSRCLWMGGGMRSYS